MFVFVFEEEGEEDVEIWYGTMNHSSATSWSATGFTDRRPSNIQRADELMSQTEY